MEEAPGFCKVTIAPSVSWQLKHLDVEYESAAGIYKIHWDLPDQHHIHIQITVPEGCEALITLPHSKEEAFVVSGETIDRVYQTQESLMEEFREDSNLRNETAVK